MLHFTPLVIILLAGCTPAEYSTQDSTSICDRVPQAFVQHVMAVLTDSTDLFQGAYPPATPLTCELLAGLQEEMKDDSARYYFERFSRKYWSEDAGANTTFRYIERHTDFPLTMAAVTHWNEDHRIRGLRALQNYRRIRPMVCATKDHYAHLEEQDRQTVRYLIRVLETTPLFINGSENATIHGVYMREVMETLDLFTGQKQMTRPQDDLRIHHYEAEVRQAIIEWRKWLKE